MLETEGKDRFIVLVPVGPATGFDESLAEFIKTTGARLISAIAIFGAAPDVNGSRDSTTDGVELIFTGVNLDVAPSALHRFPNWRAIIGRDITDQIKKTPTL